jgi:hypothetical protein
MDDSIGFIVEETKSYGLSTEVIETSRGDLLLFFDQRYDKDYARWEQFLVCTQFIPKESK